MPVDGGVHNILGSKVWTEIVQEIKGNIREGVIYCHNFQAKKIHWFLAANSWFFFRVVIFVKVKSHCGDVFQV